MNSFWEKEKKKNWVLEYKVVVRSWRAQKERVPQGGEREMEWVWNLGVRGGMMSGWGQSGSEKVWSGLWRVGQVVWGPTQQSMVNKIWLCFAFFFFWVKSGFALLSCGFVTFLSFNSEYLLLSFFIIIFYFL